MFGRRYKLVSPLTPKEICVRFRKTVGWPIFSDRSVVGFYDTGGFQLRINIWYYNTFQIILSGTMKWRGGQTELKCVGGFRMSVILFCVGLLLVAMGFGFLEFFSTVFEPVTSQAAALITAQVVLPLVLLATGGASLLLGKSFASDDERQLIQFLEETIGAEVV